MILHKGIIIYIHYTCIYFVCSLYIGTYPSATYNNLVETFLTIHNHNIPIGIYKLSKNGNVLINI